MNAANKKLMGLVDEVLAARPRPAYHTAGEVREAMCLLLDAEDVTDAPEWCVEVAQLWFDTTVAKYGHAGDQNALLVRMHLTDWFENVLFV